MRCQALERSKGSHTQPTVRVDVLKKVKHCFSIANVETSLLAVKGADSCVAVFTGLSSTSRLLSAGSAQRSSYRQSARLACLKIEKEHSTRVLISPFLLPLVSES